MLELFGLLGIVVVLYYLVSVVLWLFLDSDVELFVKEKTGKPICKSNTFNNNYL